MTVKGTSFLRKRRSLEKGETMMICPHDKEEMELVDSHYNLELEFEEGRPVKILTYVCLKCHFEQQIKEYE